MTTIPIACSLPPDDFRARRESLIPDLVQRTTHIDPIEDGYRLQFAPVPNLLATLAQTIEAERNCCRFLRFELTVGAADGPITLTITGPAGTQQFLAALFSADSL